MHVPCTAYGFTQLREAFVPTAYDTAKYLTYRSVSNVEASREVTVSVSLCFLLTRRVAKKQSSYYPYCLPKPVVHQATTCPMNNATRPLFWLL